MPRVQVQLRLKMTVDHDIKPVDLTGGFLVR
jgi:hypothetical protein